MGQHVGAVPVGVPVEQWPLPWEIDELVAEGWKPDGAANPRLFPWEVTAVFAAARAALGQYEWLLLSSTTMLECLWASFYATGSKAPLRRICDMAAYWAEFAPIVPDAIGAVVSLETPLPSSLQLGEQQQQQAGAAASEQQRSHADSLRAVRAQVSRLAVWTLLHHSRRHPRELLLYCTCTLYAVL